MKKITLALLACILFGFIYVNAETTYSDKTCDITASGEVNVKWDGTKENVGIVYTTSCEVTYTPIYTVSTKQNYITQSAALTDCKTEVKKLIPSCCKTDDAKTTCKGSAVCSEDYYNCEAHSCTTANQCYLCNGEYKWKKTEDAINDSSCSETNISSEDTCKKSILVYFNANGGTVKIGSKTVQRGQKYGFLPTPSKTGCTFNNWYIGSTVITADTTVSGTGPKTLYARWKCSGGGPQDPTPWIQDEISMKQNDITITSKILSRFNNSVIIDDGGGGSVNSCYGYYYTYNTLSATSTTNCHASSRTVTSISYKVDTGYEISSGDSIYCLQPGRNGPGQNGIKYVQSKSFNVFDCKNQFELNNGTKRVECGLANILYQTVKYDEANNKYVSNGKYTDGQITFALRLWMAAYSTDSQIGLGNIDEVNESPEIQWVPKEDFYKKTANAIKGSKLKLDSLNDYNTNVNTNNGTIGCENGSKNCGIMKSIELFKKAESTTDFDYLGGTDFIREDPKITYRLLSKTTQEITIDLPETYKYEEIEVECRDIKEAGCKVDIEIKDEDGNLIPEDSVESGYCTKEKCIVVVSPPMKKCTQFTGTRQTLKYTVTVTLRQYRANEGWVRFYEAKSSPNNYQIMISFLYKKKYCEDKVTDSSADSSYSIFMYIDCGCGTSKCEDFTVKKDLPSSCDETSAFSSGKVVEPSMSCIMNACYETDKNNYDYSDQLAVNKSVCKIYCRDEVEFYLPSKATTYAGMQFSYDLGKVLKNNEKITNTVSGNVSEPKLSAVVKNKKQCTSEINYEYWKEEYQRLLNNTSEVTLTEDPIFKCKTSATNQYKCYNNASVGSTCKDCYCYKQENESPVVGKPQISTQYVGCVNTKNECDIICSGIDYNYLGTAEFDGVYNTIYSCQSGTLNGSQCRDYTLRANCNGYDGSWETNLTCADGSTPNNGKCYSDWTSSCSGTKEFDSCPTAGYTYNSSTKKCEKKETIADSVLVDQWLYNLYNCNLYSSSDIPTKIKDYNNATPVGTTKDYIMSKVTCTTDDCLNLTVNYEEILTGSDNELSKTSKLLTLDSGKTYYCKKSGTDNCYEYNEGQDTNIKGENKTEKVNYNTGKITVPTNDYAAINIEYQNDFYQSKKYQTKVYSGEVSEGDGSEATYVPLPLYVYPVNKNTPTGSYNITFTFGKLPYKSNDDNYAFSCKYDVYNTTVLYDCSVKDEDGNIDLSRCNNKCNDIEDGVPIINSDCITWQPGNEKKYGFVYRNVTLNDLFPNAVINEKGISTRNGQTNWSTEQQAIEDIQDSANYIYASNDEYLDYRYVLTPQSIKEIKQYNKTEKNKGGYSNNTLEDCEKIKVGNMYLFKNCKSTFLKEVKNYTGVQASGNKEGGN